MVAEQVKDSSENIEATTMKDETSKLSRTNLIDVIFTVVLIMIACLLTHKFTLITIKKELTSVSLDAQRIAVINVAELTDKWGQLEEKVVRVALDDLVDSYYENGYLVINESMIFSKIPNSFKIPIPSAREIEKIYINK